MTGRGLWTPQHAAHLIKLLGLLGSAHDGERAAAALKAHQFIRKFGLTWSDVVFTPPDSWRRMATACAAQHDALNAREADFIANIVKRRWPPSDRQMDWLAKIFERLHSVEAA